MDKLTAGEHQVLDTLADAIVEVARTRHRPDSPEFAECALALAMSASRPVPVIAHNESLTLSPAALEARLASPGAKFDRRH